MSFALSALAWSVPLDPGPKLVLLSLCDLASDQGKCFPSRAYIAQRTGFGVRAVQTHLNTLKEAGLLATYRRGPRGSGLVVSLDTLKRSADSAHHSEKEVQILPKEVQILHTDPISNLRDTHTARAREKTSPIPPSLAEIADYCAEIGSAIDPQRFLDRNAAVGWQVGGQPVRDWRALLRAWEPLSRPIPTPGESHAPRRESSAERFERLNNMSLAELRAASQPARSERVVYGEIVQGPPSGIRDAVVVPIADARGYAGNQNRVVGQGA
jgi:DNA-binding transcriptional ArsR family regulator